MSTFNSITCDEYNYVFKLEYGGRYFHGNIYLLNSDSNIFIYEINEKNYVSNI